MIIIENLNKSQKIIIGILCVIVIVIIIIYVYKKDTNTNYSDNNEIYSTNEESLESSNIKIHIDGEIESPGVVELKDGERIVDAIEKAGGLTEQANISDLNLAYLVKDGQKIHIPNDEEAENEGENKIDHYNLEGNDDLVNINKATQTELETLSGIGPSTALKIIAYRNDNGEFNNIEELKNVPGIGEAKFDAIKNNICVK